MQFKIAGKTVQHTDIGHFIGGFLVAFLSFHNPVPAILLTLVFIFYQFDEQWKIEDQAWKDIRTYLVGMFGGALFITLFGFIVYI